MMTYFWGLGVKSAKLRNMKKTLTEMQKELDIGKTFDKLDQKNVDQLENELKSGTF